MKNFWFDKLNPKLFHTNEQEISDGGVFSYGCIKKKILDLDGSKYQLKSVYTVDVAKQASSI